MKKAKLSMVPPLEPRRGTTPGRLGKKGILTQLDVDTARRLKILAVTHDTTPPSTGASKPSRPSWSATAARSLRRRSTGREKRIGRESRWPRRHPSGTLKSGPDRFAQRVLMRTHDIDRRAAVRAIPSTAAAPTIPAARSGRPPRRASVWRSRRSLRPARREDPPRSTEVAMTQFRQRRDFPLPSSTLIGENHHIVNEKATASVPR